MLRGWAGYLQTDNMNTREADRRSASGRQGSKRLCRCTRRTLVAAQALRKHTCDTVGGFIDRGTNLELGDREHHVGQVAQPQLHHATLVGTALGPIDVGHLHTRPLDVIAEATNREPHPAGHIVTQRRGGFHTIAMQVDTPVQTPSAIAQ